MSAEEKIREAEGRANALRMREPRSAFFVEDTAKILGVSRQSVDRAIRSGELKASRFGARWLVPKSEIDRLLCREAV